MEKDYGSVERTPGKCGQVEKDMPPGEAGDRERVSDTFELTQFCLDRAAEAVFWIEADARFVYVNEAACRSLKYSRQELLSMTVHNIDPNFPKDAWAKHWRELRRRGSFTFESVHRAKDGRTFPVEITINYLNFGGKEYNCAFARDITDRKRAEQAAKETQERFSDFFKNAPIGFHIFGPDRMIIDINEAELAMIGYEREEIVGKKKWPDLIVPDEIPRFESHWHSVITRGYAGNVEYTLVHKDGHHIHVLLNASSRFDEQGNLVNTRGSVLDITARKHAEQARSKLIKELGAKHNELESVLYAASHDLKSPLVNIQGFGHELLQSCDLIRSALAGEKLDAKQEKALEAALNEDIPNALEFILTSTTKMDSLLSGLLDVCRLNTAAMKIEHIDMNAMMTDVTASIGYQIEEAGAKVDIGPLPGCLGDASQISRVFTNLLTNALKFLDPSRQGNIRIHGRRKDNQSIYCVEDNGIGIAPEHMEKIFEIFYQLEPGKRKGEGIGLTIVRRIIDRHNGKIWAESKVGRGSKFFVSLPGG